MIESSPSILGLGFDNIDKRIKLLNFLNNNYQLKLNPISVLENNPVIFGTKFEKLIVITRIIKEYQPTADEVQKKIGALYPINLESLLLSYSERKAGDNIYDLTRKATYIQKEKIDKETKRKLIKDFFDKHPESYKIYRDYLRGYPEK